jgi:hypothetical protein
MRLAFLLAVLVVALAACATQPTPTAYDAPGFFMGLLHGVIAPFSLVGELLRNVLSLVPGSSPALAMLRKFLTSVRVYAFPNSGGWYDFGFMLGLGWLFWGGGSRAIDQH